MFFSFFPTSFHAMQSNIILFIYKIKFLLFKLLKVNLMKMEEKMFSLVEMRLLYEKAKGFFLKSPFERIKFIYRDKSVEYFDKIDENARQKGMDKIMQGYTKNASGHPECPIIVDQLNGLYFATACDSNGIQLPSSLFGSRRISINADYFLNPRKYRLFFADFYCARYTTENHKIILALGEIGTSQELFCREHLIKMDMWDNPFLKCTREGHQMAKNENCQIYVFLCADFNISNCLKVGKCNFSDVTLVGKGVSEYKLAFGQTYDQRCGICSIRTLENPPWANSGSEILKTAAEFEALSLAQQNDNNAGPWRIWKFDNCDLPGICPLCKSRTEEILLRKENELSCKICKEIMQMHRKGKVVTSDQKWPEYIKKTEAFFHIMPDIVDAIKSSAEILWPSQMGKAISLDRKTGIGIFREDSAPDCDHPSQHNGGYFSMILLAKVGNYDGKMDKLDRVFQSFVAFIFNGGLGTNLRSIVNGILVRAEIHLGSRDFNNPKNLPCKFRFELWIRDRSKEVKNAFWNELDKWRAESGVQKDFGSEEETKFKFFK